MFCPYCGYKMKDDHLFCKNCGKKVENDIEPKAESSQTTQVSKTRTRDTASKAESGQTTPTTPKALPETVLAGFSSADMMRPGSIGYGVYITNKRVIGIKKPEQFAKAVGGAIAGAVIGKMLGFEAPWAVSSALGRNLTNDETIHLLAELEKNKDFELDRQDITLIQLKEPFLIELGHLAIFVNGQKTTDYAIKFSKDNVHEMLKQMFKTHFPQVFHTMI
jgi:uncharacterized Zn finger protein (UPF0148 family)